MQKDAFPLTTIEDSLDALTGVKWFSTLDLASGYNQVPVSEADKHKTAFCTSFGLFEFKRMPFALCNAPSTFQRLMVRIFGDQSLQSLLYLDDNLLFIYWTARAEAQASLGMPPSRETEGKTEQVLFLLSTSEVFGTCGVRGGCGYWSRYNCSCGRVETTENVQELRSFLGFLCFWIFWNCLTLVCCHGRAGQHTKGQETTKSSLKKSLDRYVAQLFRHSNTNSQRHPSWLMPISKSALSWNAWILPFHITFHIDHQHRTNRAHCTVT